MSDEIARLEKACLEVARTTKWVRRPIDVNEIDALTKRLAEIAKNMVEDRSSLGADIPLVTRAVDYLRQAHAIPPMEDDTLWFFNMLDALIEVACPNSGLDGEGRAFLRDMLHGIGTFIDDPGRRPIGEVTPTSNAATEV